MRRLITMLTIITSTATMAQTGKATTEKKTFSRTTSISTGIKADPAIIWKLLTTASDFPRWNSTVISIEGNIATGEKIKLRSTLAPKRLFKLKVKTFEPNKVLAWGDGNGTRVYKVTDNGNGTATFSMNEQIGGFLFPLYAKHIPSFDQSFEQFTADLKKEAEAIQNLRK